MRLFARKSKLHPDVVAEEFVSAFADAVGESTSESVKNALKENASDAITRFAAGAVGGFASAVLGNYLRRLLKIVDEGKLRIDSMYREPFVTGVREAREALELIPADEMEARLREKLLWFSVEKLAEAYSLATTGKQDTLVAATVLLYRGLCERELPGGKNIAHQHFLKLQVELKPYVNELTSRVEQAEQLLYEFSAYEARGPYLRSPKLRYMGIERQSAADHNENAQHEWEYSATQRARKREKLQSKLEAERYNRNRLIKLIETLLLAGSDDAVAAGDPVIKAKTE